MRGIKKILDSLNIPPSSSSTWFVTLYGCHPQQGFITLYGCKPANDIAAAAALDAYQVWTEVTELDCAMCIWPGPGVGNIKMHNRGGVCSSIALCTISELKLSPNPTRQLPSLCCCCCVPSNLQKIKTIF
jgi:hypothetical protein